MGYAPAFGYLYYYQFLLHRPLLSVTNDNRPSLLSLTIAVYVTKKAGVNNCHNGVCYTGSYFNGTFTSYKFVLIVKLQNHVEGIC